MISYAFSKRARTALAAVLGSTGLLLTSTAFADKGGEPNEHASASARGSDAAGDHTQNDGQAGKAAGRQQVFSGIVPAATGVTTFLQFTNAGQTAGTATVTLYAAESGAEIATWTSASIPPKASLVMDAAALAANATPALTAAQAGQATTFSVQSDIHGNVQLFTLTGGALSNLTPCGPQRHLTLGGIPGPGNPVATAAVRLTNGGSHAAHADFNLYDSATGALLGTWSSPDLPAYASLTVSTTAVGTGATPIVDPATSSFTLAAKRSPLAVQVLAMPKAGGPATALNDACALKGSGQDSDHSRPESDEDD